MKPPKLQRWIDLLAALLRRSFPVTFDQLIAEVPAYAAPDQNEESRRRTFERDKDELRRFGVPIETVDLDEDAKGYRLRVRDFYLPYLTLRAEGVEASRPRVVDRFGYQSLPFLSFEPEELAAVVDAGARVRQLGDPLLAEHAESALRKLACDLPVDASGREDEGQPAVARPRAGASAELLATLGGALEARKRVSFRYHAMGSGASGAREVEPVGLFYLNQHWYLAARASGETLVKNYRLNRMGDVQVNKAKPGTRDYEIPADFRLRDHARSRHAWELGAGDAVDAVVAFVAPTGAAAAARRLGEEIAGHPDRRRFTVRRVDAFARWLLAFGGDVVPVTPDALVESYQALVRETLAHHRALPEEAR